DPPALQVRAQVAQDVREVEGDPQILRVGSAALLLVAEDAQADQPHDRGDTVAVSPELLERGVALVRQVHLDAGEKLLQVGAREAESLEMRAKGARGGLLRLSLVAGRDLAAPHLDLRAGPPG